MMLVLGTDAAILLDIPVLRQVLGFSCFAIIPGLLILYALKLNRIGFLKRFLLSVGLSISFLIFWGLLINVLLPLFGYPTPLSTPSLVISMTIVLMALGLVAYWRNRDGIQLTSIQELVEDIKNKHLSLLLFPLLFPLLTVIGRNQLDTYGDNRIILATFALIPLYVVLLIWQNKKVPKATYPVAIGMISISLLLARGLVGNYLMGGGDIYSEYHQFQVVSTNLHWAAGTPTLSTSFLPAVFQSLLGINPIYIYKVVLLIPISLIPLIGYVIYEKYLGSLFGFLSSFFCMAQIPFIYMLSGQIRIGVALVSFALALMVLFDDSLAGLSKRILFLIFAVSLVVEYYVLPVIFLVLMLFLWVVPSVLRGRFRLQTLVTPTAVLLLAVLIYFWWGQTTTGVFPWYVIYVKKTIIGLSDLFVEELRSPVISLIYSVPGGLPWLTQVSHMVQRISLFLVGIGVISTLAMKDMRARFSSYTILMLVSIALLALEFLPWLSFGYGPERLYLQLLIVLAPAFVIGCQTVFKYLRPNLRLFFIGLVMVILFLSSSRLPEGFTGTSDEVLSQGTYRWIQQYVYDSEVVATEWLGSNNTENLPVYMGWKVQRGDRELFEYTDYGVEEKFEVYGFSRLPPQEGFVFLRFQNTLYGQVFDPDIGYLPSGELPSITEYARLFTERNLIYDNGKTRIYR